MELYIEAQLKNYEAGRQAPHFRTLVGSLDSAYRAVLVAPDGPLIFGRLLLICHKSALAAASLIAQTQPEDSVGITRRAVEVGKVALAIKLNDENAVQWTSYQERHDRWLKRQQGEKPSPFRVQFKDVKDEPLMAELDRWLGILSDASVHFTPEFYDSLDWDTQVGPDGDGHIFLNYFHRDVREIERHYMVFAAVHGTILKVFDKCMDHGISKRPETLAAVNTFWATAKSFNDAYQEKYHAPAVPS
jgi:hypothetical protein